MIVYPQVKLKYRTWINQVVDEIKSLSCDYDKDLKLIYLKKSNEILKCMTAVKGNICNSCGKPTFSAEIATSGFRPSCDSRICPRCARKRSIKNLLLVHKAIDTLTPAAAAQGGRRRWRMITITARYDKTDPDFFNVQSFKRRIKGLKKTWRGAWREIALKDNKAGAFAGVEIAGTGNIHMHILHHGKYIDNKWLQAICESIWSGVGHIDIRLLSDKKDIKKQVYEVVKYSMKSAGLSGEKWFTQPKKCINPKLAALWEISTRYARLNERYGFFREVKVTDKDKEDFFKDQHKTDKNYCTNCGCTHFNTIVVSLENWVHLCHSNGMPAFRKGTGT